MALPPGYRFRPARDEDAGPVAAFANEECEALIGARVYSATWLQRNWTAPSIDRERDVAVVEGPDGALCGYFGVGVDPPYTEVSILGIVALPCHGRGIGAAVVAESERRARRVLELVEANRRVVLHADTLVGVPQASSLMTSCGYREVRRFWLMRIDFDGEPAAPRALPGIEVRTLRPDVDARAVFEADREAFADHWGAGEPTYEDFRHYVMAGPMFDPALCHVAWSGDEVAGYMTAIEESRRTRRAATRRCSGSGVPTGGEGSARRSCVRPSGPSTRAGRRAATSTSTPSPKRVPLASTSVWA